MYRRSHPEQYIQPSKTLFNATIGQYGHIIELFVCLEEGYERGLVNYDKRRRIEELKPKGFRNSVTAQVYNGLNKENKELC
jgi:hypothetical protein